MADYRLKIKLGDHEFEAEGEADVVQAQFAMFKELVASVPVKAAKPVVDTLPPPVDGNGEPAENGDRIAGLDKIMKIEGRVVSLTVRAANPDEGVLLMLLGQRQYRGNNAVTGSEIVDGLTLSGQRFNRIDRVINKLSSDSSGLVITVGQGKGRRYRLTNAGVAAAQGVAQRLIALVP